MPKPDAADGIPAVKVITDPDSLGRCARDEAWAPAGLPHAVARPQSTGEVRAVVAYRVDHRIPVIPRGAGTGLSGGANAVDGAVALSFEDMNRILRIDPVERLAVVQPGVMKRAVKAALDPYGILDPGKVLVSGAPLASDRPPLRHSRAFPRKRSGRPSLPPTSAGR
ncbi:FAD-binding oxidoreductase [Streptomyces sp. NPDC049944]|uniref:FAD-binding oxidoreductase n=1 Tax=Streptomyces sp. NPDC049944 TaxID=3155657 RepID=UPI0034209239